MTQQTAVQWLKMKLEDENSQNEYINPSNPAKISFKYVMFVVDYALKMEKEQIQRAFSDGQQTPLNHPILPNYSREEYYNDTYNK